MDTKGNRIIAVDFDGTDRVIRERLPEDQCRYLHRRQGSKSNEKTADRRTYIVKPIRQPDRPRSIHRNTENERSRKKGI